MAEDTWYSMDLPVLEYVHERIRGARPSQWCQIPGGPRTQNAVGRRSESLVPRELNARGTRSTRGPCLAE